MGRIRYAYCKVCKKEISNPVKKSLDSMQKNVWIIVIIATLGIAAVAYLFYNIFGRSKNFCPNCETKLVYSLKPFEKPKEISSEKKKKKLTKKEQVLEKVEVKKVKEKKAKLKKLEEETIICSFCGERIEKEAEKCPYCKTVMKF